MMHISISIKLSIFHTAQPISTFDIFHYSAIPFWALYVKLYRLIAWQIDSCYYFNKTIYTVQFHMWYFSLN